MKKTNKILLLILTLIIAISIIAANHPIYAATDDDGYEVIDINKDSSDDETPKNNTVTPTNTTGENKTNNATEGNVIKVNKTNTANNATNNATNKATNKANQATTNHPQTGEFMNVKVIAIVSIAAIALVFAFAKVKKYSF